MRAVGLLSPGDMGHTVAQVLIGRGMSVLTNLSGRSDRTRTLARSVGIEDVSSYEELVRRTDLILSIVAPAEARNVAQNVARALEETGEETTFVDCNAVSPATAEELAEVISDAGGRFVDASIIGPPPRREGTTRFYASGRHVEVFAGLGEFGLDVCLLGRHIGQASGLKMAYAAFTKGTAALSTELLVAAHSMGLYDALIEEFQLSQPEAYEGMVRAVPAVPKTARRWAGEMEEIARTFSRLGLTPKVHEGAAEVFRFVDGHSLADTTSATPDRERLLRETVESLARSLDQQQSETRKTGAPRASAAHEVNSLGERTCDGFASPFALPSGPSPIPEPMTTRFDHAVIAVADLERAVGAYRSLGFDVFPGGRHEHRGTHNALIRFDGGQYIELLSVYDPDKATRSGPNGRAIAEFLRGREGGLIGHCYATHDIETEAARMRGAGLELVGPFEMRRQRPDGRALTWRLLVPVDVPWRRRWPFFIQWDNPIEERLAVEGVGAHPNGASAVTGAAVGVRDLEEARTLYSILFDAEPLRREDAASVAVESATLDVHGFTIDLLAPNGEGPVQQAIESVGEGPLEVTVEVADPESAVEILARAGIEPEGAREGTLRVPAGAALGARLVFVGPSDRQGTQGAS